MNDRQQRMVELAIEVERSTRKLMDLFDLLHLTTSPSQWRAIYRVLEPAIAEANQLSQELTDEVKEMEKQKVKRIPLISIFVFMILSLLLFGSVAAQVSTDDVPTPTQEVTVVPTAEVTPDPLPPVTNPGVDPGTAVNLITLITGIAIGVVTAGGGFLVTIAVVVSKIRNDRPLLAAIEGLIASRPPEDISKLRELGGVFRDTADIIEEVTDDIPVTTKPLPITPDEAARIRQAAAGKRPEPPQGEPEG